jgi:hypothetical protein
MKRRYRDGRKLSGDQFAAQEWTHGILQFVPGVLPKLGLYVRGPGHKEPIVGTLYRPVLSAVFSDTISFAGVERGAGGAWVHQTWYCELRREG